MFFDNIKDSVNKAGEAVSDLTKFDVTATSQVNEPVDVEGTTIAPHGQAHLGKYGGKSHHIFHFKVKGEEVAYKNQWVNNTPIKFIIKKDGDRYVVETK